jgi:hypothetical protein
MGGLELPPTPNMGGLEHLRTPNTTPTMKGSPTRPPMGGVHPTCTCLSPPLHTVDPHGPRHPSMHLLATQVAPPHHHQPPRLLGSTLPTPALLQHSTLLLHHHGGLPFILHSLAGVHHLSNTAPPCLQHGGLPTLGIWRRSPSSHRRRHHNPLSLRQHMPLHCILPQHPSMRNLLGSSSYVTCNHSMAAPSLPLNGPSSGLACNPSLPFAHTLHLTVSSQMESLLPPRPMLPIAMPSTSYLLESSAHLQSTLSTTTPPFMDGDLNC